MELTAYTLEDLLLAALKSEVESKTVYSVLAERVRNAFLKDRLTFLAGEEEKHKRFVEGVYKKRFPGKGIVLPERTPVPLPALKVPDETIPLSEVFKSAMEAERLSHDFYKELAAQFSETDVQRTLLYFADMEMNHYRIVEAEYEHTLRFEDFDTEWLMMNVGP